MSNIKVLAHIYVRVDKLIPVLIKY